MCIGVELDNRRSTRTRKQYAIGVLLCVLVSIIWVLSSELTQYLLDKNSDFEKKSYLFTYLSTSVFCVLLLRFRDKSWRREKLNVTSTSEVCSVQYSFRVATMIAPIYFFANWTYNSGLELTSVSSSSTIQNTSSLFAFFISVALRMERFSWRKLFACAITIMGTVIITEVDGGIGGDSLMGDGLSILSSLLFAIYTTVLQVMVPNNVDITLIFSFVGLLILLFGWCLVPFLNVTAIESFKMPNLNSVVIVLGNATIGFVLADLLWAKSIVLTSSFVGNTATSLTVPFSLLYDCWFKRFHITLGYGFGAVLVVVGSVMVSIIKAQEDAVNRTSSKVKSSIVDV